LLFAREDRQAFRSDCANTMVFTHANGIVGVCYFFQASYVKRPLTQA
jgi:hypothetical protein